MTNEIVLNVSPWRQNYKEDGRWETVSNAGEAIITEVEAIYFMKTMCSSMTRYVGLVYINTLPYNWKYVSPFYMVTCAYGYIPPSDCWHLITTLSPVYKLRKCVFQLYANYTWPPFPPVILCYIMHYHATRLKLFIFYKIRVFFLWFFTLTINCQFDGLWQVYTHQITAIHIGDIISTLSKTI